MKKSAFIEKIRILFDKEFRAEIKRDADLKDICRALKIKKRELKKSLKEETDEIKKQRLLTQIDIIHAQQHKALLLRKKKKKKKKKKISE